MNRLLTAIENTFLISLSSTFILISSSHFHIFFPPFSSTFVFYFILFWHFQILAIVPILSQSICCWASDGGCPTLCHVLFTWGTQWLVGRTSPASRCLIFYPGCARSWKQMWSWCLNAAKFLQYFFFKGNRQKNVWNFKNKKNLWRTIMWRKGFITLAIQKSICSLG